MPPPSTLDKAKIVSNPLSLPTEEEDDEEEEDEEDDEEEQEAPLLSSLNHVNSKRKRGGAPSSFPRYKVHK